MRSANALLVGCLAIVTCFLFGSAVSAASAASPAPTADKRAPAPDKRARAVDKRAPAADKRAPATSRTRTVAPSGPAAPAGPVDPIRDAFARATAPALGDSTRTRLMAFIARYPHHPLSREAWLELGTLAYAMGEYSEARDDFRRARGGGVIDRARLWEARALLALGAPKDARALVQSLSRARTASAQRWEASEIVALSWTNEGKRSNALATYRALLAGPTGAGEAASLYQAIELADEAGAVADSRNWRERLVRTYPRSPEAASVRAEAAAAPADALDDDDAGARDGKRDVAPGGGGPGAAPKRGGSKNGASDARSKS
jgi:hypothetical protein